MSENIDNNYGILINKDAKLFRGYFKEMLRLLGVKCIYRAPMKSTEFDHHGELEAKYYEPMVVNCIFDEHPAIKTLKKMGWVAELQEGSSMIHVPYDLPHLEVGALFTIPSPFENSQGRVFRVIAMQTTMIYPSSVSCEIAPEYESTAQRTEVENFKGTTNNVLVDNEDDD